jgi:hypothetical protein
VAQGRVIDESVGRAILRTAPAGRHQCASSPRTWPGVLAATVPNALVSDHGTAPTVARLADTSVAGFVDGRDARTAFCGPEPPAGGPAPLCRVKAQQNPPSDPGGCNSPGGAFGRTAEPTRSWKRNPTIPARTPYRPRNQINETPRRMKRFLRNKVEGLSTCSAAGYRRAERQHVTSPAEVVAYLRRCEPPSSYPAHTSADLQASPEQSLNRASLPLNSLIRAFTSVLPLRCSDRSWLGSSNIS